MSLLIRCVFTFDDGTVIHDETVVSEIDTLLRIDKGMEMLGQHGTLSIIFDPPLIAEIATEVEP